MTRPRIHAAWDALRLLHGTTHLGWSAAGRVGAGTHVGKVMYGGADFDILCLVDSTWADVTLIGDLPRMLTAEVARCGLDVTALRARVNGDRVGPSCTLPTRDQVAAALDGATPGPWTVTGEAAVTGAVDDLEVSGSFTIIGAGTQTTLARASVCDIEGLASVRLIVEGHALLTELTL